MRPGIKHQRLHNPPPGCAALPEHCTFEGVRVQRTDDGSVLAEARGLWPFKRIVVGPFWFTLDARTQVATLFHELGHIRGFHFEIRLLCLPFLWADWVRRLAVRQELAADRFAVRKGFGLDLALMLQRVHVADGPWYPSLHERMAALAQAQGAPCC